MSVFNKKFKETSKTKQIAPLKQCSLPYLTHSNSFYLWVVLQQLDALKKKKGNKKESSNSQSNSQQDCPGEISASDFFQIFHSCGV